jgi:hypothetical protein
MRNLRVESAHDPAAEIPPSGSFAFITAEGFLADPRIEKAEVEARLRTAVVRELGQKGYTPGETATAFRVGVYSVISQEDDPTESVEAERLEWLDAITDMEGFQKGVLIIDLVDPETERPFWRGVCGVEIVLEADDAEKDRRVEYAVHELFARFPPTRGNR